MSGQLGTLRASPYFFFLDDLWDRVRVVDENGISNLRTQNAGDVKYGGANFSASLRQWGPLSGTVGLNLLHGSLEGSGPNVNNFTATAYQVNGNVTMRLSPTLNVQANANYSPWSPMAQGKQVQTVYSTVAIRQQLFSNRISAALSVLDPFDVYRMRFETKDSAHLANGRTNPSQRRATLTLSYNFGRTPQSNRRTVQDAPTDNIPGGGGGEVR